MLHFSRPGAAGLALRHFHPFDIPVGHADTHIHGAATYFAIDDKFRATLRLIESQREGLPAMRAIDGKGLIHGATVRPATWKCNLPGRIT